MNPRLPIALLTAAFLLLFSTSSAQALTLLLEDIHGADGSLTIEGDFEAGTGSFDVEWYMNFDDYEGGVGNHQYLTAIGFKAFSDITSVSLDSIMWSMATGGTTYQPSNISNAGCALPGNPGSQAGLVCVELNPDVDATLGGDFYANFTVEGTIKTDEWSYRGKLGPEPGWVISESGVPVPEPTAAMLFAAGLVVARWRVRRARA